MFKKGLSSLFVLAMALMVVSGLTACGGSSASTPAPAPTPAAEPAPAPEPEVITIVEECDEQEVLEKAAILFFNGIKDNNNQWTIKDAEEWESKKDSMFLLDIRAADDFNKSYVDGFVNIPFGQLGQRLSELPKDQEIAVSCYSGNTGGQAVSILKTLGYKVKNVTGGMNKIKNDGFIEIIEQP